MVTTIQRAAAEPAFQTVYRISCRYDVLVHIACMSASSVLMSFRPLAPPGTSSRARTHALHVPIIACIGLIPGLEPPGCKSGPISTFLVVCVVILSLSRYGPSRKSVKSWLAEGI